MKRALRAAVLDGSVVVLDPEHARVILLDPWTERIWRACTGLSTDEIAAIVHETPSAISPVLRELGEAGLVADERGRWDQAGVTWI